MMKNGVLVACLAFVSVALHGCGGGGGGGGGGGDATTVTTTTVAVAPMISKSPYNFENTKEDATLELAWSTKTTEVDGDMLHITVTATYPGDKYELGWLAVGWSPDGKMENGDYVMGYSSCVRALVNKGIGSPPDGSAFNLTDDAFSIEGPKMTLSFTRPLTGSNPISANGNHVLVAAGSTKVVPHACDSPLTKAHHHDLGGLGFVTSPSMKFDFVSAAPAPSGGCPAGEFGNDGDALCFPNMRQCKMHCLEVSPNCNCKKASEEFMV